MDFTIYIKPELLVLLPILYGIGVALKKAPFIKDWLIPILLICISVVLTFIYILVTSGFAFSGKLLGLSVFQGVLLALSTVGSNQLYKQATEKREEDNEHKD